MSYKVLVIDDDDFTSMQIKLTLESDDSNYQVLLTKDGKQGIQVALSQLPNIILLDIHMPVIDGLECLKMLKGNSVTADIPVIMITSSENIEKAITQGAIDFIRKPVEKLELLVRVRTTLNMHSLLYNLRKQSEELEIQKNILEIEKKKSDDLLLNILPYEIAEQLKNKGYVDAKQYRRVSVMFADFVSFTKIARTLKGDEIVQDLGLYFNKFDEIIEGHFIEKIKTIGDAYMCAGGLPIRNRSNPIDITLASLKIQKYIIDNNTQKTLDGKSPWELRIGIHTGEVIAGVIGRKKFAYDIWGDTVNKAQRLETAGVSGKVNISGDTYQQIKDYFDCTYRGKIEAKNTGFIDMYFVNRLKVEYSSDEFGITPNEKFIEALSAI